MKYFIALNSIHHVELKQLEKQKRLCHLSKRAKAKGIFWLRIKVKWYVWKIFNSKNFIFFNFFSTNEWKKNNFLLQWFCKFSQKRVLVYWAFFSACVSTEIVRTTRRPLVDVDHMVYKSRSNTVLQGVNQRTLKFRSKNSSAGSQFERRAWSSSFVFFHVFAVQFQILNRLK